VQPNIMICERCGDQQVMPEGTMRFSTLQGLLKTFEEDHENCEEKTK